MSATPLSSENVTILKEVRKCRAEPCYFLDKYVRIKSEEAGDWVPFFVWPAQRQALATLQRERQVVILKARQTGFSWLVLGLALWRMLLHPSITVLIFSKRDDEAIELLDERLKGMHERLPPWLQSGRPRPGGQHDFVLANGSRAKAFPTTGGRSYTASLVIVDEADFIPDLSALLDAVKPTIDAGGQIVLLSTSDKSNPASAFKRIYLAARKGEGGFFPLFHSWQARPGRTQEWYEEQKRYFMARDGSLDMLQQEYAATPEEALSPRSLDKRIAPAWLQQCFVEARSLTGSSLPPEAPAIPGLVVYAIPRLGARYIIGADPAEGNPTSDDSALTVLDAGTGEEVASLAGRLQPAVFAAHIDRLGRWYNYAGVMVERNNHGHAVLLWLTDNSSLVRLLGHDGKDGWLSNSKGKALLYDACADAFRESATILHSFATFVQLSSIEGATLRAPEGEHDDRADAHALGCVAIAHRPPPRAPFAAGARTPYVPHGGAPAPFKAR